MKEEIKKEIIGLIENIDNLKVLRYIKQILIGVTKKD